MKKLSKTLSKGIRKLFLVQIQIIFSSVCIACLDELRKQQIIDQHVYDQKLMEDVIRKLPWEGLQINIVMDGDTMIDKRTGEVLNPEGDSTYWKEKF